MDPDFSSAKKAKRRGCLLAAVAVPAVLCLLEMPVAAGSNALLTERSAPAGRLGDPDKARLAEALRLRAAYGEAVWPGWGGADIPVIIYTGEYAFLVGYTNPPDGWRTVPAGDLRGGAWETVPDDGFRGRPYYRTRLTGADDSPQAFTVRVGDKQVASLPTRGWMKSGLADEFSANAPAFFRPILPSRLAAEFFLLAAGGTDLYECAVGHEMFHAFEGLQNPERLISAEALFGRASPRYPSGEDAFRADWQAELDSLADALQAKTDADAAGLAATFLALRDARRSRAGLDPDLIDLERLKEWEEGLAKYSELMLWRSAFESGGIPAADLSADAEFHGYAGFAAQWSQQVDQIRRMAASDGDLRFYYSGFAQAALLDRLSPGWRTAGILTGGFPEDLLRAAIAAGGGMRGERPLCPRAGAGAAECVAFPGAHG